MENIFNTITSNNEYYSITVDQLREVNAPEHIIPWSIVPVDSLGNDLSNGDRVAYVTTYYDDRFEKMCLGTIIGFTECFIKIKPDEQYINTYQEKEYILRKYNRVIRL